MKTKLKFKIMYSLWLLTFILINYYFYNSLINNDIVKIVANFILLCILTSMVYPIEIIRKQIFK